MTRSFVLPRMTIIFRESPFNEQGGLVRPKEALIKFSAKPD